MDSVVTLHMPPHGPVQEYWLVGLVWYQVADERLSTWFYDIGLALQLGAECTDGAQLLLCKLCGVIAGLRMANPSRLQHPDGVDAPLGPAFARRYPDFR